MTHAQDLNLGSGSRGGCSGCGGSGGLLCGGSLLSGTLGRGLLGATTLLGRDLLRAGDLDLVSGLLAGRLDLLKHAEHRGHAGLVVVGAQGAGREVLKEAAHAQQKQGQRTQDADDPDKAAEALGQKTQDLDQSAEGDAKHAVAADLPQQRQVLGNGSRVQGVLVRRVIVGHDHDGSGALLDLLAATLVESDDVLAAGRGAQARNDVGTQELKDKQGRGHRDHEKADRGQDNNADTSQKDTQEDENEQASRDKVGKLGSIKLLDLRLDAVLAHQAGDGLRRLKLFLATRRSNADLLVQVVHIVVCHGHMPYVLFGRSRRRLRF